LSLTPEDKIIQLEKMMELDPDDSLGWFMLAKLYLDTKQFERAAEGFERCLALRPDHSAAWRHCGDAYRRSGNLERAKEVLNQGIVVAEANGDLQTVKEMKVLLHRLEPEE